MVDPRPLLTVHLAVAAVVVRLLATEHLPVAVAVLAEVAEDITEAVEVVHHPLVTVPLASAVAAVTAAAVVDLAVAHRPAAMGLHPVEDHPAAMEHPPTEAADPRVVTVHRPAVVDSAVEDLPAVMALLPTEVVVAAAIPADPLRRATAHRRVETGVEGHPLLTEHRAPAVGARPVAMVRQPVAVADSEDHLRVTVHLAPVVAVSEALADIPEAEVVTLEETEVVVTPEETVVATLEAAVAATPVETEVATLEETVVATLEEVVTVATLEEAEVEVATLEEAEVVILEEAVVVTPAVGVETAEVVKAMLATEVININRNNCPPRARTFELVSPVSEHHRTKLRNSSDSETSTLRSKHDQIIRKAKNCRSDGGKMHEAESKVARANSTSFPKHPEFPLKV